MNISYDEIRRIYRLEKNTAKLVEVDQDFFESLNRFVKQEKKEYLKSLKNLSSSKARSFNNLKKMVEEIFSLREKKLLNKALISSRTGDITAEKMAIEEEKTFKELLAVLEKHRKLLNSVFGVSTAEKKPTDKTDVMLQKDIPAFVGADMKEYGPFNKNQTVKLPVKIADLLMSRGLAKKA